MNPALISQYRNVIRPPSAVGNISVAIIAQTADDISTWTDWKVAGAASNASQDDHRLSVGIITGPTATNMTRGSGPGASPTYTWTNGTLVSSGSLAAAGNWGVTTGGTAGTVDYTVTADTLSRTARFLVGTYVAGASSAAQVVRFTLSDASFAEQVLTPGQNLSGFGRTYTYYEITYNAASGGQTLRLRLENTPGTTAWTQYVRIVAFT